MSLHRELFLEFSKSGLFTNCPNNICSVSPSEGNRTLNYANYDLIELLRRCVPAGHRSRPRNWKGAGLKVRLAGGHGRLLGHQRDREQRDRRRDQEDGRRRRSRLQVRVLKNTSPTPPLFPSLRPFAFFLERPTDHPRRSDPRCVLVNYAWASGGLND